ncbi:MAG: methyltransferase domain-containing protein [Sphingorhabdus sp.]
MHWIENFLTSAPQKRHGNALLFEPKGDFSENWHRQQNESVERYVDDDYEADGTLGELFGGFIATSLDREGLVLDIGCGLHPVLPHYVKHLNLKQFLGIEPLPVLVERDFACLTGVAAEKIPLRSGCANAAIFSTSLDHIENAAQAISEVVRVLKPGFPLYFWLGIHDPHILAESKTFAVVHTHSRGLKKLARIVFAPLEHAFLAWQMYKRHRDLKNGIPLDDAHVRYHTLATIDSEMSGYGLRIVRKISVPGSASAFIEAVTL